MKRSVLPILLIALLGPFAASQKKSMADMDKEELAMLGKLEKSYVEAKAVNFKKPSPAAKKTYLAAALKYADAVLISPALGPKDKYPKSLRVYREVRKVEPTNKAAKEKIDLIEGIYKSMGRPIPK